MRPGTPGFVGPRLREAREARGMTPAQLAELLGVSRQVLSQYETDASTPRPDVMDKVPGALNVPRRFFFLPPRPTGTPSPLFFRSMSAATKTARGRAAQRQEWLSDVVSFIESYVELPAVNLPALGLPSDPMLITPDMMEAAAIDLRRAWGLRDGVISDLVLLLENNGFVISRGELWSEHLDAFSHLRDGRPIIFLATEKGSAARSRFNAAHELAHVVLHRGVDRAMLLRKEMFRRIENQAHYFAAALLMPATSFAVAAHRSTLDVFRAMKPIWKVSIGAMIHRASDLGLTSDPTTLWRSYGRRGWRKEEPLDRELSPEEPGLLRRAFELILGEGVLSRDQLLNEFSIPAKDIEELAGLPPGFLDPAAPRVRLLQFPTSRREG